MKFISLLKFPGLQLTRILHEQYEGTKVACMENLILFL